ncbi:hypothetical protein SDC9_188794 [bioreactor metagenome]|uniref:Uncharacterized protein n=1 Tax=bioreactor metagenome TaxID=1076179 RepID=A0A645HRY4_9ZZZZ
MLITSSLPIRCALAYSNPSKRTFIPKSFMSYLISSPITSRSTGSPISGSLSELIVISASISNGSDIRISPSSRAVPPTSVSLSVLYSVINCCAATTPGLPEGNAGGRSSATVTMPAAAIINAPATIHTGRSLIAAFCLTPSVVGGSGN